MDSDRIKNPRSKAKRLWHSSEKQETRTHPFSAFFGLGKLVGHYTLAWQEIGDYWAISLM